MSTTTRRAASPGSRSRSPRSPRASPRCSSVRTAARRCPSPSTSTRGGTRRAAVNVATCVGHASVRSRGHGRRLQALGAARTRSRGWRRWSIRDSRTAPCACRAVSSTRSAATRPRRRWSSLARVAARHRGFYISHIRDEADMALEAMTELVNIGERAKVPVQNTHIKLGHRFGLGQGEGRAAPLRRGAERAAWTSPPTATRGKRGVRRSWS